MIRILLAFALVGGLCAQVTSIPGAAGGGTGTMTSVAAGAGVTISGTATVDPTISVDTAVVPTKSTAAGAPAMTGQLTGSFGVDTSASPDRLYFCGADDGTDCTAVIRLGGYDEMLPLAGGTLTGQLITDNLGIEFEESDTNPTCAAGNFNIYADASENKLKACQNGSASDLLGSGGSSVSINRTVVGPIYDEFIGGTGSSGAIGQLQWNFTASGGTIAQVTAEDGHPGIIKCTTSAAANGSCSFILAGAGPFRIIPALNGITNWEFQFTFRTPNVTSEIGVRVGFTSSTSQAEPAASGIYAEYRNNTGCTTTDSDTGWNYHSDSSGSRNSDTGPSFSATTWYTLRIRSTSAGTALMSMATDTGAFSTEKAITINYTSPVTPFMQTYTCAAAAKTIEMDWFAAYMTGVAR